MKIQYDETNEWKGRDIKKNNCDVDIVAAVETVSIRWLSPKSFAAETMIKGRRRKRDAIMKLAKFNWISTAYYWSGPGRVTRVAIIRTNELREFSTSRKGREAIDCKFCCIYRSNRRLTFHCTDFPLNENDNRLCVTCNWFRACLLWKSWRSDMVKYHLSA